MQDNEPAMPPDRLPAANIGSRGRFAFSIVWVIPLVATVIGGWLAWKAIAEGGPVITIVFKSAEGLEPGKTTIRYRDVEVGKVSDVRLSEDRASVVVTAEMRSGTDSWMVNDTRFWVVRPRVVAGNISGLSTLLSGAYVGMDVGKGTAHTHRFHGLDVAPPITSDRVGKRLVLKADELGSLDIGSPIYYRHIKVGQILGYELDANGAGVTLQAFVEAPFDRFVTLDSRFWHASGLDVTVDASGIKLDSESLLSMVIGGLAFAPMPGSEDKNIAPENTKFTLFENRAEALSPPKVERRPFILYFNESLRGLSAGAPVDFRGLQIGEVLGVRGEYDPDSKALRSVVDIGLMWNIVVRKKMGPEMVLGGEDLEQQIQSMVAHGLRAQLRTGNLISGQLYVALDFFPTAKPAKLDWSQSPPQFPTMPGALQSLAESANNIIKKIDNLPLDKTLAELRQAARSLDTTLRSAEQLLSNVDREVMPEAKSAIAQANKTLDEAQRTLTAGSPLQHDAREALAEVTRAAQSLRVLMDYLEQHPEALLLGKEKQP